MQWTIFTVMLIHRPGLTFDESSSFFSQSLGHCTAVCSEIIRKICCPNPDLNALGILPLGPSLILQCGLMQMFHYGIAMQSSAYMEQFDRKSTAQLIQSVCNTLSRYAPANQSEIDIIGFSAPFLEALLESSQLLQNLYGMAWGPEGIAPFATALEGPSNLQIGLTQLETASTGPNVIALEGFQEPGALENLNYFNFMYSVADTPFELFQ